jgi:hypothetical protein
LAVRANVSQRLNYALKSNRNKKVDLARAIEVKPQGLLLKLLLFWG